MIGEGTEGLATAFGQYVGGNAEELSGQAEVLERQEPDPVYIYVRTFVEQMAEAVKAGWKIDLAAVLRLCKWVVEQPLDGYGAYIPVDGVLWKLIDKDWQWARNAICRFIRAVCDPTSEGVLRYPWQKTVRQSTHYSNLLRRNPPSLTSQRKPLKRTCGSTTIS